MIKKRISLTYFRQEIGKILKESEKNGLYNIPYQTYNKSPNRIKKRLIKKYNNLENELLSCIKEQERVYLLLCDLKNKTYNTTISQKDILDLFLNTDTKLIYEPLPLNEKINKAQELLTEKISNAKNVLLDIYYIHKTIIVETYRIGWEPNSEINLEIRSVMEKHFLLNKSYSTSQDYYLLKQIAENENFDIAYNLYYKNIDKFVDLVFIKINTTDNSSFKPINLYKPFESIKGISRNLYSPFYGDKVNFISGEITQRINNISYTQRNVFLDSNTVSYIRTIVDEKGDKFNLQIKELINDVINIKKGTTYLIYHTYLRTTHFLQKIKINY